MGGALSRTKGHTHERWVATQLREAFPNAIVRRSDQGWGAANADVVVEGDAPILAKQCWFECQVSRNPTPLAKLEQAEGDAKGTDRLPVVVWRAHGERRCWATMRLGTLAFIARAGTPTYVIDAVIPVTLELYRLIEMLKRCA